MSIARGDVPASHWPSRPGPARLKRDSPKRQGIEQAAFEIPFFYGM